MDSRDLTAAIFAGNDVAMQWYALTHNVPMPGAGTIQVQHTPQGSSLQLGAGGLVLIGLVVIGAIIVLK